MISNRERKQCLLNIFLETIGVRQSCLQFIIKTWHPLSIGMLSLQWTELLKAIVLVSAIDSIYRNYIWYDSTHSTTMLQLLSDFHSGTTPHTSPLRAWYGVSFARYTMKKWTWYIESALYPETMPTRHWVLCMIIRNFWNLSCFMILVHVKCQLPSIALHLFMKCQKEGINLDLKELMNSRTRTRTRKCLFDKVHETM